MTNQPFAVAVRELLEEQGISQRELSKRTQKQGWGHLSTVNFIVRGDVKPSIRAMEQIAKALQVRPEYFAEYRLAKARNALDPAVVGLDTALKHGLKGAEQALAGK